MSGRGGAGNILERQQESRLAASDLEAAYSLADLSKERGAPADPPGTRETQQYAHKGRGGAGNYYSPRDLKSAGSFHDTEVQHSASVPRDNTASIEPVRKYGRGGAGNMTFGVTEDEERAIRRRTEEELQRKQELGAHVEASVQALLPRPPKARLPRGQS